MAKFDSYKCDSCGTIKGAGNHWFRLTSSKDGIDITPWRVDNNRDQIHLCSDQCVTKTIQHWLNDQKVIADAPKLAIITELPRAA